MKKSPDELTEEFLKYAHEETGVSWKFLYAAEHLVKRAFVEVPEHRLQPCLDQILKALHRQAEVERLAEEAKASLSQARTQITALQANGLFGTKNNGFVN